jgi:DNA-binding NarL/FixJ family response regulator
LIRIFLADDHEVVRKGIRLLLRDRQDWQVCGEAANGRDTVRMVSQLEPDIAVIDVSMPEMNGFETTREIKRVSPKVEVLIYSVQETELSIRRSVEAGALGYAVKADSARCLIEAVEAVSHHRPYFTTRAPGIGPNSFTGSRQAGSIPTLTGRELEIIQMLAEGKANKAIATMLCISVKTVETHRAIIKRKLGIGTVVELVHYAVRNNLVQA